MIGGKMIGHRPISTSQHHPGAQRRQLRTGAIEAEQGQRGHGGRKPGKGMNLATSPQNECENRRRRPSRGLAHTPGTPIFALFRWTSERAASIRCPDGGSGQGSFASFLKGPLPPSGHRIERGTIDLQSDINCLPERSLLGAFGKQHDDYDHDVFNSAGSTLATPHFGPENGVHLKQNAESGQRPRRHRPVPIGIEPLQPGDGLLGLGFLRLFHALQAKALTAPAVQGVSGTRIGCPGSWRSSRQEAKTTTGASARPRRATIR